MATLSSGAGPGLRPAQRGPAVDIVSIKDYFKRIINNNNLRE
jgi:hypothetical protein